MPRLGEASPESVVESLCFCFTVASGSADADLECLDRGLSPSTSLGGVLELFVRLVGEPLRSDLDDLGVEDLGVLVPERDLEPEGESATSSSASRCFFTFPALTGLLVPLRVLDFLYALEGVPGVPGEVVASDRSPADCVFSPPGAVGAEEFDEEGVDELVAVEEV